MRDEPYLEEVDYLDRGKVFTHSKDHVVERWMLTKSNPFFEFEEIDSRRYYDGMYVIDWHHKDSVVRFTMSPLGEHMSLVLIPNIKKDGQVPIRNVPWFIL